MKDLNVLVSEWKNAKNAAEGWAAQRDHAWDELQAAAKEHGLIISNLEIPMHTPAWTAKLAEQFTGNQEPKVGDLVKVLVGDRSYHNGKLEKHIVGRVGRLEGVSDHNTLEFLVAFDEDVYGDNSWWVEEVEVIKPHEALPPKVGDLVEVVVADPEYEDGELDEHIVGCAGHVLAIDEQDRLKYLVRLEEVLFQGKHTWWVQEVKVVE